LKCDGNGVLEVSSTGGGGEAQLNAFTDITDANTKTKLLCDSAGHLQVDVLNHPSAISGFALETTQSAMSAKLPSALDSDSLKVAIQSGATPAITGFALETTQSTMNGKITQGYDTTISGGGNGLQQVLIYGRENGGDLRALECVGDRLIVDCIELSPTGPHTPTSLPSVAIHGQVGTTSGFKNLRVDTDGRLEVSEPNKTKTTTRYASQSISGNDFWAVEIDASTAHKVQIVIENDSLNNFLVYGSDATGGTFIPVKTIMLTSEQDSNASTVNIGEVVLDPAPKFIKIKNVSSTAGTANLLVTTQKY